VPIDPIFNKPRPGIDEIFNSGAEADLIQDEVDMTETIDRMIESLRTMQSDTMLPFDVSSDDFDAFGPLQGVTGTRASKIVDRLKMDLMDEASGFEITITPDNKEIQVKKVKAPLSKTARNRF